ncbi:MAG: tetratricopeptide repeat protein [Candidatus Methanofastidiosum sp.]|nr:tetratricopeptide repeat protein [Methanofastidiosum sp.]
MLTKNDFHEQRKNKGAINAYTKALFLNPNDPDVFFNRGNVYHDIKNMKKLLKIMKLH